MKKYTLISLGFALFLLVIIYLANTDSIPMRHLYAIPNFDKIGHFTLFGLMAFFINRAMGCRRKELLGNVMLVGSLWLMSFVVLEEFSQIFIESRNFDVSDLMYDMVGIYFGGFIAVATSQPAASLRSLIPGR
ncbi:MAG: VanZ family protein [Anaerolineae bacterium]